MKRFLTKLSIASALGLSLFAVTAADAAEMVASVRSVGPRNERRVVYHYVDSATPYALTGEAQATTLKRVRVDMHNPSRNRLPAYRWVEVD